MEITLPISSLVIIAVGSVGVTVAIFMGILLLSQKNKKHIFITLLSALLILSGLTLLNNLLTTSGISNRIQELYFIPIYYSLSIPPLFFLFVKSKFKHRLTYRDALHLVIPVIQALVYFTIGFRSVEYKSALYNEGPFRVFLQAESFLFPILLIGYAIASLAYLKRNKASGFFWSRDLRHWLKTFAIGMLLIAAMELGLSVLEQIASRDLLAELFLFPTQTIILSAFAFWIAANGFKQYYPLQIFTSKPAQESPLMEDKELSELVAQLEGLMQRDKVFLNPDLNLQLLAQYLGVSEKRCSYVLNRGMDANFNRYVNTLRIEAFKERIKEGQNRSYTLTSIAYECGFDSKSTFNRVFKSICGITPSEFVRNSQK